MDEMEEQRVRQWIRNWEAAAPVLKQLRDEAIRNSAGLRDFANEVALPRRG